MSKPGKVQRRRELRRHSRNNARKSLFVSDYVYHKYYYIYSEAEEFYNAIDSQYPTKRDLKKTPEYLVWKKQVPNNKPPQIHPQIDIIPAGEPQPSSLSQEPLTHGTGEPKSREQPSSLNQERVYTDNLQLRIPLISHKSKSATAVTTEIQETVTTEIQETVTTEIQETVMEETIEEGTIYPSIHEEISSERMLEIIEELRLDPDLKDLFTDIEFEQLGMDIDIPEQYSLENLLAM